MGFANKSHLHRAYLVTVPEYLSQSVPTYTQGMSMTEMRGAALNTHFSMLNFNNYVEICFKSNTEFSNMMSFLVK